MERQPKTISRNGIAEALAKVQHYRYLNEPEEAESICRDILAVDPENQMGLRQLGLALTDQFKGAVSDGFREAQSCFEKLSSAYERYPTIREFSTNAAPKPSCAQDMRRIPCSPVLRMPCAPSRRRKKSARRETMTPYCAGTTVYGSYKVFLNWQVNRNLLRLATLHRFSGIRSIY